ncbi:enoyl-CoA hydratase/isomerase family protein [Streptomyces sp. NPDC055607]
MTASPDRTNFIGAAVVRQVAVLTLQRPEALNALDVPTRIDLAKLIRAYGTGTEVRGIVLTGDGKAFSAGEDLKAASAYRTDDPLAVLDTFHDITRAILQTRVPVVAAVNGIAVGGASEIAMSCDVRIGTPASEYLMPENRIGLTVSNASSLFLRRLVGHHATRLVLASRRVDAAEAHRIGLLDALVPAEELIDRSIDVVHECTPAGGSTTMNLALLRPTPEEVKAAMDRENSAALAAWNGGFVRAGIERFRKTGGRR